MSVGILAAAVAVLLSPPAPALAQTSAQDVSRKTAEAAEAIRDYTVERKDLAVAQARKLARGLDAGIKKLEAKASQGTKDAQATSRRELAELKDKRAKAEQKLAELTRASAASWDSVKHGTADAFRDLQHAYDKAATQLTR